ncbi:hypothetical protein HanXRQr2_Chr13g0614931 [Helianthus annuus]|uniref:Uncharacterized protein n=1 Tax=Helianthus annuus TaxID=4232 RepID=A0A9K3HE24_HELAN|nr:hypothetical protein HanXRQr2_Chr13g0614931 [Helianthus annuus]
MGTLVGFGALTLRQAVIMAAVLEFSGALDVGGVRSFDHFDRRYSDYVIGTS